VTLATLLLAATSGGSFPPRFPPVAGWSRSGSNPILSPSETWEETAVYEPVVLRTGATWRMWYGGGWDHPALGYATSTDGITWTKYASNPVYGQGGSSYANTSASAEVIAIAGTLWLFTSGGSSTTDVRSTFRVATSADGIAWTTQSSSISLPSGKTLWGNRTVWIEGSTWYMLQEAGPTAWEIYLYTSSDGLTWSIANSGNPLTTLQVAGSGMYGGPNIIRIGATYHLWYHAAPVSGNLPTNIYHATSTNRISWTQTGAVLTYTGSGFEVDQVADPSVIVVSGTAYLFYDGDDNGSEAAYILLATAPATA
jgi:sucrose-6-phosphate hydrolase SacC (GH32 family)